METANNGKGIHLKGKGGKILTVGLGVGFDYGVGGCCWVGSRGRLVRE